MKYPYLTVSLLVVFGLIDIAILGNQFGLDATTWPGWVQAVGSVAALAVAIYVMSRQNAHARSLVLDADRKALLRRAAAVGALMGTAMDRVQSCADGLIREADTLPQTELVDGFRTTNHMMTEARYSILAVPAHELGSHEMAVGVHEMAECLGHFKNVMAIWIEVDPSQINIDAIKNSLGKLRGLATTANNKFQRGVAELRNST